MQYGGVKYLVFIRNNVSGGALLQTMTFPSGVSSIGWSARQAQQCHVSIRAGTSPPSGTAATATGRGSRAPPPDSPARPSSPAPSFANFDQSIRTLGNLRTVTVGDDGIGA